MITVVKQILGHHVTVGGEPHSGWWPRSAATPLPTPANNIAFNITIEFDGHGYLLCYASEDGALANDSIKHSKMRNRRPSKTLVFVQTNGKRSAESLFSDGDAQQRVGPERR
jgi:hypothetical protein